MQSEGFHQLQSLIVFVTGAADELLETSCGFLLINFDSILLLQYPQGHWSFPKGHVEVGDSDHHHTALRELSEETGITEVTIDHGWKKRTEYTFSRKGRKIPKQVFWYLAETNQLDVQLSHEHNNFLWLELDRLFIQRHLASLTREAEATELDHVTCRPICLVQFLTEKFPSPEHRLNPRNQFAH